MSRDSRSLIPRSDSSTIVQTRSARSSVFPPSLFIGQVVCSLGRLLAHSTSAAVFGAVLAVFAVLARIARIATRTGGKRDSRSDGDEQSPEKGLRPESSHGNLRD